MNRNRGFSLIELLVALAVFSIMGVAVTSLFVQGLRTRRQNQLNVQAQAYANLVLEHYKSTWADPDKYSNYTLPNLPPAPQLYELDRINRIDLELLCAYLDGSTKSDDNCNEPHEVPPLRRVQVTLIDHQGNVRADMTTEIGNPRP